MGRRKWRRGAGVGGWGGGPGWGMGWVGGGGAPMGGEGGVALFSFDFFAFLSLFVASDSRVIFMTGLCVAVFFMLRLA